MRTERFVLIILWFTTLLLGSFSRFAAAIDVLVVCPPQLQAAAQPWIDYRKSQGFQVSVISPPATAAELREQVREIARHQPLRYLVLIGDAGAGPERVPTGSRASVVNRHFGSEPEIASDNFFADLDDDHLPDLAMGRMTVDSDDDLSMLLERIKNFERVGVQQEWRRRINTIAGVGGFDPLLDRVLEQATRRIIQSHIPEAYPFSMTFGSWSSPYCPAPERFSETAINKFNEGCLFWVYVGHGHRHGLDRVLTPKGRYEIADNSSAKLFRAEAGSPIVLLLCCYAAAFDDPRDCFAEELLRQPRGPVAVIGGTRVTMPYAMSLLSLEMMQELFMGHSSTLGEIFQLAKRRMITPDDQSPEFGATRRDIVELAKLLSPRRDLLDEELVEHLYLYHLLGDPLLQVSRPTPLRVVSQVSPMDPRVVHVECDVGFDGELTIEVCYPRHRFRSRPIFRDESRLTAENNDWLHRDYLQHQNLVCTKVTVPVKYGRFSTTIELPESAKGALTVRAFLTSPRGHAIGADAVVVE